MRSISKIKSLLFTCLLIVSFNAIVVAQDPNFSQFYNNPVYYNPGMTAIANGITVRMQNRSLWTPIAGKFDTYSVTFEGEAINKVGLGAIAGEGLLRTNHINFNYSYRVVESRNMIFQVGFSGGITNKFVDWSKFTFSDQLDEVFGRVYNSAFVTPSNSSKTYADFGSGCAFRFNQRSHRAGTSYKRSTITLGGAVNHLNRPSDGLIGEKDKLPMKFVAHGNANVLINKMIYAPGFIFERQAQFQTITLGGSVINKPFSLGFWVRNRTYLFSGYSYDSFITSLGINVPLNRVSNMRVTYSFDLTISRLRTSSIGSHEISLIFDFDNKKLFSGIQSRNNSRRRYRCPSDFKGYD
jgi:type IX secretion system PorP/SprF family membrane protein